MRENINHHFPKEEPVAFFQILMAIRTVLMSTCMFLAGPYFILGKDAVLNMRGVDYGSQFTSFKVSFLCFATSNTWGRHLSQCWFPVYLLFKRKNTMLPSSPSCLCFRKIMATFQDAVRGTKNTRGIKLGSNWPAVPSDSRSMEATVQWPLASWSQHSLSFEKRPPRMVPRQGHLFRRAQQGQNGGPGVWSAQASRPQHQVAVPHLLSMFVFTDTDTS